MQLVLWTGGESSSCGILNFLVHGIVILIHGVVRMSFFSVVMFKELVHEVVRNLMLESQVAYLIDNWIHGVVILIYYKRLSNWLANCTQLSRLLLMINFCPNAWKMSSKARTHVFMLSYCCLFYVFMSLHTVICKSIFSYTLQKLCKK